MKELKILILCISLTILLYSCKDNSTNPVTNNPQPVVFFTYDSLVMTSSDSGRVDSSLTIETAINDTSIHNLKMEFNVQSNTTLPEDIIYYSVNISKTGVNFLNIQNFAYTNLDTTFSIERNISAYKNMKASFTLTISRKSDHSNRFIRYNNIKLTKLD